MNYIAKLESENRALKGALLHVRAHIEDFRVHLDSDKFAGQDANGERKDWIATADVRRRLADLHNATW